MQKDPNIFYLFNSNWRVTHRGRWLLVFQELKANTGVGGQYMGYWGKWASRIAGVLSSAALISPLMAQTLSPQALERQALEEQYHSCPQGYYSGPRPGRNRYTKDEYLWVVTPEFAAAYCMPTEFIDKTLKGAEAVAYKPVQEGSENCGFGGNKEACGRRTAHGFEIYYKSSLKLPSVSQTKYNYRAFYMLPSSKHLLSPKNSAIPDAVRQAREAERPGLQRRFEGWGLVGVKGTKPMWPITQFGEIQYIEDILPGYNYLSLEGTMGRFSNPRFEKLGLTQFVLVLDMPGESRKDEERDLRKDYGHVIYLPVPFVEKIRQVDQQGDEAFRALLRQAMPQTFR